MYVNTFRHIQCHYCLDVVVKKHAGIPTLTTRGYACTHFSQMHKGVLNVKSHVLVLCGLEERVLCNVVFALYLQRLCTVIT